MSTQHELSAAARDQALRTAVAARLFTVLVLAAPVLWYRDAPALAALLALTLVMGAGALAQRYDRLSLPVLVAEAGLVAVVCGLSIDYSTALLLSLAVAPFIASLVHGLRGLFLTLGVELVVVVSVALLAHGTLTAEQSFATFSWCMAGLGVGLVGNFLRSSLVDEVDDLAPYRDAQRLLQGLLVISGDLRSGLDVTPLGGQIGSQIRDLLPASSLGIYVTRDEVLVPLTAEGPEHELTTTSSLATEAWARGVPITDGRAFAFPLGESTVAAGSVSPTAEITRVELEHTITELIEELRPIAVQLDTALMFSDFRDAATADVRRRLAREMHDGIAQDLASLGYVVDALASRPADEKQRQQLLMLRDRISAIVSEVRQSVLTLRTSIGEAESLGAAIGNIARHLSESSQIPIQVTLDEQPSRLRPEIEAELFRIAQEAMNNAVKHARATSIEVNCRVHAPDASIVVIDDGRGMQTPRSDSQGLKIMRERARLIGAELEITASAEGGLIVAVTLSRKVEPVAV